MVLPNERIYEKELKSLVRIINEDLYPELKKLDSTNPLLEISPKIKISESRWWVKYPSKFYRIYKIYNKMPINKFFYEMPINEVLYDYYLKLIREINKLKSIPSQKVYKEKSLC